MCAVVAMWIVVLAATVIALLTVLDGDPERWSTIGWVLAGLALWCAVVSIPAALRHRSLHCGETSRPWETKR
jgi:hypothetical protein